MLVHEPLEPALRDDFRARLPDHIPDRDRLHGFWILGGRATSPTSVILPACGEVGSTYGAPASWSRGGSSGGAANKLGLVHQLPPDFAKAIARVVEPGHEAAVAGIIEAATAMDDGRLRVFLQKFAARVRSSPAPVTREELQQFLQDAAET